ncbi:signal peptidase I [Candidatus Roizmanbacteria bacterium CG_4_9_14_0_2_um_filter_39_13]|uniref:Signal peptidase I n=1 Tax=Candidatus Roizmanbacteria bacterium CG_4_9_14_0_2_um_filter_39_13 TaxID=1974839 RepID=A0A2M8EZN4_9BACT|nr:MAG: signal peptidase I [Candidatus Roizmanbacteria bacterium CG_4_10_14_0_2_um_filter_39_12]PJC32498.1 MAG: signal peptidase I [Candidatus Roizmanbacteria bacterium CG_4_9_14_0_2_um_filter_39_13]
MTSRLACQIFMEKSLFKKLLLQGEFFFGLILVLVIFVSVFPLMPPFKNYYHSRTVLTGSMEPKVPKGSVVINKWTEQKNLKVDDVITFQHTSDISEKEVVYITHRIVKIDKNSLLWRYETKGDANPVSDFGSVTQAGIEGKVIVTIPFIGYLIEFFKTPAGFILFVALPLLIFIIRQIRDILRLWQKRNSPKNNSKILVVLFIIFSFLTTRFSLVTYASFTSGQAVVTGVTLSTATSFGSVPQPGDVIINEIMWMGSEGNINDEWIELRNMTDHEIDLSNWKLTKWVNETHEELMLTIPSGKNIEAHGYFLISNFSKDDSAMSVIPNVVDTAVVLANEDLQVKLYRGDWTDSSNLIDTADDGNGEPVAGVNGAGDVGVWKSMERGATPGDGTLAGSWHSCIDPVCNDGAYWDANDGSNYGTPGSINHSENDPSSLDYVVPTITPTPGSNPVPSITPTGEPESTPTLTPTLTPSPSLEIFPSPTPTSTSTPTPSVEPSPSPSLQPTSTPTPTSEQTPTDTPAPSPTSILPTSETV